MKKKSVAKDFGLYTLTLRLKICSAGSFALPYFFKPSNRAQTNRKHTKLWRTPTELYRSRTITSPKLCRIHTGHSAFRVDCLIAGDMSVGDYFTLLDSWLRTVADPLNLDPEEYECVSRCARNWSTVDEASVGRAKQVLNVCEGVGVALSVAADAAAADAAGNSQFALHITAQLRTQPDQHTVVFPVDKVVTVNRMPGPAAH
jgi:hypothetical protein